jgi:hypothetical protein
MSFFTDRDRTIYAAPSGRKYDPVDLYHRLEAASGGHLNAHLERWWGEDVGDGERAAAALELAKVARTAFGFKPFDAPDGTLDADVLDALYHFLRYREGKG